MIDKTLFSIFQQGSKTYFYSSLFFPSLLRKDVFSLYAFVRKADNYVDAIPQNTKGFYEFKEKYQKAVNGKRSDDIVINSFIDLANRKSFDESWTDAFLASMESDITKKRYNSIDTVIDYMYGSAEVIGLYMAKIMDLPTQALYHARYLGRAMQYVNFIRDIAEDLTLDRRYMPANEMKKYGLIHLDYKYVKRFPIQFSDFIRKQLQYYIKWQLIAEEGFKYIPLRYLIPIKTASDMYLWTAEKLYNDPFIVFQQQLKPRISDILSSLVQNLINPKSKKPKHNIPIVYSQQFTNSLTLNPQ
jgi:phytoene synthase